QQRTFMTVNHEMRLAPGLDSRNFRERLFLPVANLFDCPRRMLSDQWLRIGRRAFERRKVGCIACIAECDAHIAQKTAALDTLNWGILEPRTELVVVQIQIFAQRRTSR